MKKRYVIITAAVAVALIIGGGTAYVVKKQVEAQQYCANITANIAENGEVVRISDGDLRIVVLGDSYSSGAELLNPEDAWIYRFAASSSDGVSDAAIGGTGYVNGGYCGDQEFGTRLDAVLATDPDVLIVQGGVNDSEQDLEAVSVAADEALRRSRDVPRVVLLGPANAPALDNLEAVDAALRGAAESNGREYVSALNWDLNFLPDGVHLTPEGHNAFAAQVTEALR